MAALYTAPGYSKFDAFCAECEGSGGETIAMAGYDATNWVSDEEEPESDRELRVLSQRERQKSERADLRYVRDLWKEGTTPTSFDLNSEGTEEVPTLVETEDEVTTKETPTSELLRIHHALGHLSMRKLRTMAKQGIIPRRGLAKCQVPLCSSCLYGKATRRPWRTKPKKGDKISKLRTATSPGQCVSVDQLESPAPGLIAQMKGWLTKKRYRVATVFVDNFSGLSYVYLQKTTNADETLMAKKAFERFEAKSESQYASTRPTMGGSRRQISSSMLTIINRR